MILNEIEKLYDSYEKEVYKAREEVFLKDNTVKAYLTHSRNFVKCYKWNFEPGGKNK